MPDREPLIGKHGGFRTLKSFQLARLIYDVTVRFCDRFIDRRSRTHDQMVQAARSGVQNLAEGSQASGTSKKMEMKLTNVARSSLEELRLDYEDFLRQKELAQWSPEHPALLRFKAKRCATLDEVRAWLGEEWKRTKAEHGRTRTNDRLTRTKHGQAQKGQGRTEEDRIAELVANAALSLLNICCHLIDNQLAAQAKAFEREGGFTERLYKRRKRCGSEE
jgi:four helix bundle suffix protein